MGPCGRVLVTGATSRVGREVVRMLRARGVDVRAAAPSLDRVRDVHGSSVDAVRLDLRAPDSFRPACEACDGIFLLRPSFVEDVHPTVNALVDAAIDSGARHIVFLSVAGVSESPLAPHYMIEQHLRCRHAIPTTLLRPGFFAQNLGDVYRLDIAQDDRLFVPASHGRVAFVDIRDVAEVAARIFEEPERHRDKSYTLTGPAAVSFSELADLFSQVLGRRIRYESATVVDYVRHLHDRGLPLGQIAVQTLLHVGLRFGEAENVDTTLECLLGRRGRTVERYVRENEQLWSSGANDDVAPTCAS